MSGSTGDGMSAGQWLPLVGLTLSAFIFNTSEFMPIGLLTDIAVDLHVTEARGRHADFRLCVGGGPAFGCR